jgi:DNA repair protein RecO (recombination protein O)
LSTLVVDEGFLMRKTPYKEGGIIALFLTKENGVVSLLAQGIHRKSAPIRAAYLTPLSHLELVYYGGRGEGLRRLKESRPASVADLTMNPVKQSILFFLADVCARVTQSGHHADGLYNELIFILEYLHHATEIANVPLFFLNRLTVISGIQPHFNAPDELLNTGINPVYVEYWQRFSTLELEGKMSFEASGEMRGNLLEGMLLYLRAHLPNFGDIKSLEVLRGLM